MLSSKRVRKTSSTCGRTGERWKPAPSVASAQALAAQSVQRHSDKLRAARAVGIGRAPGARRSNQVADGSRWARRAVSSVLIAAIRASLSG